MKKQFVAINDPLHDLLRGIANTAPLVKVGGSNHRYEICYSTDESDIYLPDEYFSALGFTRPQIRSFGFKEKMQIAMEKGLVDATKIDERCSDDARMTKFRKSPPMLSADVICFGAGTLRPLNTDRSDPEQTRLRESVGKIEPRQKQVFGRFVGLRLSHSSSKLGRDVWESTNIIYGDVLGELQQIWARAKDEEFLGELSHFLQSITLANAHWYCPYVPSELIRSHFRCQTKLGWETVPSNSVELMRRVEQILGHLVVESHPATVRSERLPIMARQNES